MGLPARSKRGAPNRNNLNWSISLTQRVGAYGRNVCFGYCTGKHGKSQRVFAAIPPRLRRSVSKDAFRYAWLDAARTVAFYNRIKLNEKNWRDTMSNHSLSLETNKLPTVISRILIFSYGAVFY